MSEWWTYRISSFLLFSPRTYHRLFELYNRAIWPVQVVAAVLGMVILVRAWRGTGERERLIPAILAACWLWVAIAFLALRYATINFAAVHFAWGFGIEAALLVWVGVVRRELAFERPAGLPALVGVVMFIAGLAIVPLIGPMLGRSWQEAELFGVAPDPTVIATLGILLVARGRWRWALMVVPVLWCAVTGAFLSAMEAPEAWVAPTAAVVAVALMAAQGWMRRRSIRESSEEA
jgi:hypothetical protein